MRSESFEKYFCVINTLLNRFLDVCETDEWQDIAQLNQEIDSQLRQFDTSQLNPEQKEIYGELLSKIYEINRNSRKNCEQRLQIINDDLLSLRKKQNAGSVYQQIQDDL